MTGWTGGTLAVLQLLEGENQGYVCIPKNIFRDKLLHCCLNQA